MSREIELLRVFVSSPGDTIHERDLIREVIDEQNVSWGSYLGIMFEFIGWETHTYPSVDTDPQEVINRQIPDYDVYVGILATRLGTPTPRYNSGTVEEFEDAYARLEHNPNISIMFYFRTIDSNAIDPDEHQRIKEFQQKLSTRGVYYFSYRNLAEFEAAIRLHFIRLFQRRIDFTAIETRNLTSQENLQIIIAFFRAIYHQWRLRRRSKQIIKTYSKLGDSVEQAFRKLENRTLDDPNIPLQLKNRIAATLAKDFRTYSKALRSHSFYFLDRVTAALLCYIEAFSLIRITRNRPTVYQRLAFVLTRLLEALKFATEGTGRLVMSIGRFPEINPQLSGAKQNALKTTKFFYEELMGLNNLAEELQELLNE